MKNINPDNLESDLGGFKYYEKSEYPLTIDFKEQNNILHIEIYKLFKDKVSKEKRFEYKLLGRISNEQLREMVLECLEKF